MPNQPLPKCINHAPSNTAQAADIYVTRPDLPPLDEFIPYLQEIWASKTLTNNGPFHQQLEQALCDYLGVKFISLFTNCTIALMTALKALEIKGEVITTPYSFVATSNALLWNNLQPVFADIDAKTFNLDPSAIEKAITPNTSAILAVHCYGNPCAIEKINEIANKYQLKIIYDAAHAFGVSQHGHSILNHGDLSVLSFHATKVFNTFEGGAVISHDAETKRHIDQLKNFGFVNEVTVNSAGINGKMSEFNAAFGLLQLKHVDQAIDRRARIHQLYTEKLAHITGITLPRPLANTQENYSYFPILVNEHYPLDRNSLYKKMQNHGIYGRRYFYPLISELQMYQNIPSANINNLPVANRIKEQVICLPIYPTLTDDDVARVVECIVCNEVT